MAEDMKRLIEDGEIVGYQWHQIVPSGSEQTIFHSEDINGKVWNDVIAYNDSCWIDHDSFDNGIKVGDEWWFVGDRIQDNNGLVGPIQYYNNYEWNVLFDGTNGFAPFAVELLEYMDGDGKRIGTIYDTL